MVFIHNNYIWLQTVTRRVEIMKIVIITGESLEDIDKAYDKLDKYQCTNGMLEFPEVYCHPKVFCEDVVRMIKFSQLASNPIIIKTFSNAIVNLIGIMISKGYIDNNDVVVDYTYKGEQRNTSYDKKGYIKDWKVGFFSHDRIDELWEK